MKSLKKFATAAIAGTVAVGTLNGCTFEPRLNVSPSVYGPPPSVHNAPSPTFKPPTNLEMDIDDYIDGDSNG